MTAPRDLALVAGAGPGLGTALLRCFENEGMKAVGLSRSGRNRSDLDIRRCDLSDRDALASSLDELMEEFGAPKIVVHNPAKLVIAPLAATPLDDFEACWRAMVFSAAALARATLQPMVQAGGGSFIVSGATASIRGGSKFAAFSSAKFALRGLTQALAREFQPAGVHVVHMLLDGIIDSERSRAHHDLDPSKMIRPQELATAYWQVSQQPPSAWTHEMDFRPQPERF